MDSEGGLVVNWVVFAYSWKGDACVALLTWSLVKTRNV